MSHITQQLARAHMSERLVEASTARRGRQLTLARRRARRAERAALQARLALTRSL
jgi:hypothetical protein